MKSVIRDRSGFSLVSAMVGLALAGVALAMVLDLHTLSSRSLAHARGQQEFQILGGNLMSFLRSEVSCQNAFLTPAGLPLEFPPLPQGGDSGGIPIERIASVQGLELAIRGTRMGDHVLEVLELRRTEDLGVENGFRRFLAQLRLGTRKSADGIGAPLRESTLLIEISTQPISGGNERFVTCRMATSSPTVAQTDPFLTWPDSSHRESDCIAAGGNVVFDTNRSFCKMSPRFTGAYDPQLEELFGKELSDMDCPAGWKIATRQIQGESSPRVWIGKAGGTLQIVSGAGPESWGVRPKFGGANTKYGIGIGGNSGPQVENGYVAFGPTDVPGTFNILLQGPYSISLRFQTSKTMYEQLGDGFNKRLELGYTAGCTVPEVPWGLWWKGGDSECMYVAPTTRYPQKIHLQNLPQNTTVSAWESFRAPRDCNALTPGEQWKCYQSLPADANITQPFAGYLVERIETCDASVESHPVGTELVLNGAGQFVPGEGNRASSFASTLPSHPPAFYPALYFRPSYPTNPRPNSATGSDCNPSAPAGDPSKHPYNVLKIRASSNEGVSQFRFRNTGVRALGCY